MAMRQAVESKSLSRQLLSPQKPPLETPFQNPLPFNMHAAHMADSEDTEDSGDPVWQPVVVESQADDP